MNRQDIVPDWPATIGNFQSSNTRDHCQNSIRKECEKSCLTTRVLEDWKLPIVAGQSLEEKL
jgi:hypothetical protein